MSDTIRGMPPWEKSIQLYKYTYTISKMYIYTNQLQYTPHIFIYPNNVPHVLSTMYIVMNGIMSTKYVRSMNSKSSRPRHALHAPPRSWCTTTPRAFMGEARTQAVSRVRTRVEVNNRRKRSDDGRRWPVDVSRRPPRRTGCRDSE